MEIKLGVEYRTRDGHPVRIYSLDGGGAYPVQGAIWDSKEAVWFQECWCLNGQYINEREYPQDLVEVKKRCKKDVWVNVAVDDYDNTYIFTNDFWPHSESGYTKFARVKVSIDCEQGEGLK